MFHEFREPKPVVVTPMPYFVQAKSPRANAIGVFFSVDQHNLWMVVFDETGEVVNVPNNKIRFEENWTYGRMFPEVHRI
jgi:hypothetical protein